MKGDLPQNKRPYSPDNIKETKLKRKNRSEFKLNNKRNICKVSTLKKKIICIFLLIAIIFIIFSNIKIINTEINTDKINDFFKYKIPIAYSANNKYIFPTLVSMISLLENIKYENTFYDIYVLISYNFTRDNINILKSVQKKYPKKCSVYIINMGNMYIDQKVFSPAHFYRLSLHEKLLYINKIIYLDGDTLIFDDLTEMINLDMKDNYVLGFLDSNVRIMQKYGLKNAVVVCSGVLLMDLKALRRNNATEKFRAFMKMQNNTAPDQNVINYALYGHIGALPPKYGMWGFTECSHAIIHNNVQMAWIKYNTQDVKNAFYHPSIIHFTSGKPFYSKNSVYFTEWWNYAKKSGYSRIMPVPE